MLLVGLSGGIGSGKSTVGALFALSGAIVIDADQLAREVVAPGSSALADIVKVFGEEMIAPDGSLQRERLSERVFADTNARQVLESITHPRIRQAFTNRVAKLPDNSIVIHEIPLLVETGAADKYHLVVIVESEKKLRVERLVTRGMSRDQIHSRMDHQSDDLQRRFVADIVIDNNSDTESLATKVAQIFSDRLVIFAENLIEQRAASRYVDTPNQLSGEESLSRIVIRIGALTKLHQEGPRVFRAENSLVPGAMLALGFVATSAGFESADPGRLLEIVTSS